MLQSSGPVIVADIPGATELIRESAGVWYALMVAALMAPISKGSIGDEFVVCGTNCIGEASADCWAGDSIDVSWLIEKGGDMSEFGWLGGAEEGTTETGRRYPCS